MNDELKKKFVLMEKNKAYYLHVLNQYDPNQLKFKASEDQWSILQLVDHLIKVESQTLQFMFNFDFSRKDEKLGLKATFYNFLLQLALKSPMKFKVPVKILLPQEKSKALLLNEWEDLRLEFEEFLNSFPLQKLEHFVFFHPRSGKLNVIQTLGFLNQHLAHHRAQIKRISKSKNFPTSVEK